MNDSDIAPRRSAPGDHAWRLIGGWVVSLTAGYFAITLGIMALFGVYRGPKSLIQVAGWFIVVILLLWLLVIILEESHPATGDPELTSSGLYFSKIMVGAWAVACAAAITAELTAGRALVSAWRDDLGLGPFWLIFMAAGLVLTIIGYARGVIPYRAQWRAWNRRGRKPTPNQEEHRRYYQRQYPVGGEPRGYTRARVGPFKISEWIPEFILNWVLSATGLALFSAGLAIEII